LTGGIAASPGVEIGNLDESRMGIALPQGRASLEVLCNRQSLLGNPFDMKKNEAMRTVVLDAYSEFLKVVLGGANTVDIEGLALKRGMSRDFCGRDWRALYEGAGGAAAVRQAFLELTAFSSEHRERGPPLAPDVWGHIARR